jgi:hypothetical protein
MACYAIIQVSNRRRFGFYPTLSLIYLVVGYSTGAKKTILTAASPRRAWCAFPDKSPEMMVKRYIRGIVLRMRFYL